MAVLLAVLAGIGWLAFRTDTRDSATVLTAALWQTGEVNPLKVMTDDYPLRFGGVLVVARGQSERQQVAGLNALTGTTIWTSQTRFSKCRMARHDGKVFVLGSQDGLEWECLALEAATGRTLWRHREAGRPGAPPSTLAAMSGGVCWTEGNQIVSLDAETGALRWRNNLETKGSVSAPLIQGHTVYAADGRRLRALRLDTGAAHWSLTLPAGAEVAGLGRPILESADDKILVAYRGAGGGGVLCAVDAQKPEVLWTRKVEAPVRLRYHQGRVFLRAQDLSAYDAATGRPLWWVHVGGCGSLQFKDDKVFLVDAAEQARILGLDAATGQLVWTRDALGSCQGLVISETTGFIASNNRMLYALAMGVKK